MMESKNATHTSIHGEPEASIDSRIRLDHASAGKLVLVLSGDWTLEKGVPAFDPIAEEMRTLTPLNRVEFSTGALLEWDSGLLVFLTKAKQLCDHQQVAWDPEGLPSGARQLLSLAAMVPPRPDPGTVSDVAPLLNRIGEAALKFGHGVAGTLSFIGETFLALLNLLGGRARFKRTDLNLFLQDCGVAALPIVSLISFLVGLILAFVGAVQMRAFGAQIYVADLVALAMAREMGAMMVGIVMAGRTGAAFAAQIGTMRVNEEIDALVTLGVDPVEFLVLPRILALVVMMPFLCLYADLMGILGGAAVGLWMLDLAPAAYFHQTQSAVNITQFAIGLFKSGIFGIIIALAGCLRGLQSGRSASAVGDAATSAVVTSIVWIIVADAVVTLGCDVLRI